MKLLRLALAASLFLVGLPAYAVDYTSGGGGGITSTNTTDNAVLRGDGTGGNVQGSGWSIDDSDVMSAGGNLAVAGFDITSSGDVDIQATTDVSLWVGGDTTNAALVLDGTTAAFDVDTDGDTDLLIDPAGTYVLDAGDGVGNENIRVNGAASSLQGLYFSAAGTYVYALESNAGTALFNGYRNDGGSKLWLQVGKATGNITLGDSAEGTFLVDMGAGTASLQATTLNFYAADDGTNPALTLDGTTADFDVDTDGFNDVAISNSGGAGRLVVTDASGGDSIILQGTNTIARISSASTDSVELWAGDDLKLGASNDTTNWVAIFDGGAGTLVLDANHDGTKDAKVSADGVEVKLVESATPSHTACADGLVGTIVYVDDTDDTAAAQLCACIDLDDGTTFDWRKVDDLATACTSI